MSRRVFLDVGANNGQSLAVALRYDFDWIVCFEPAKPCWPYLAKLADDRVTVERFGLFGRTGDYPLYEPGIKGASLYRKSYAKSDDSQLCQVRRASDWFADKLTPTDRVWLKLNCEGAELLILADLLETGAWVNVTHALVFFHAHKMPELAEAEWEMREHLATMQHVASGVPLADWLEAHKP